MITDVFYREASLMACGATVESITPLPKAQRNSVKVEIPGSSIPLHEQDGTLQTVQRTLSVAVRDERNIDRVNAWCAPYGPLRVSSESSWVYMAVQTEAFEWPRASKRIFRADILFELQPFKYLFPYERQEILTAPGTLFNRFQTASTPLIRVEGEGDITLQIGGQTVLLYAVEGYIQLDSMLQVAHRDGVPQGLHMYGAYPVLPAGATAVSWEGDVRRVEIMPRWRLSL